MNAPRTHLIVLPGGGYSQHAAHEGDPVAKWLTCLGFSASVFLYPLLTRHPAPLLALRDEIERVRANGAERIGAIGFSAGGHLAGLAALAPGGEPANAVDFAVLGYAITSMQTDTYRPAREILLGAEPPPALRRATSLDALVTPAAPPFFLWHTAEDPYVPPEHTYRLARSLAEHRVPHTTHVFAHGPHSLGLAHDSGGAAIWTTLAARWIGEQRSAGARDTIEAGRTDARPAGNSSRQHAATSNTGGNT